MVGFTGCQFSRGNNDPVVDFNALKVAFTARGKYFNVVTRRKDAFGDGHFVVEAAPASQCVAR
jgi:hypothetical protein